MPSHPLDHHTGRISLILLVEAIQGRSECGSPEKRNASKKRTCRHGEDPRQDVRSHRGEAVPGGRIHNSNRAILSHSSLYPRDKAIKSIRRAKGGGAEGGHRGGLVHQITKILGSQTLLGLETIVLDSRNNRKPVEMFGHIDGNTRKAEKMGNKPGRRIQDRSK